MTTGPTTPGERQQQIETAIEDTTRILDEVSTTLTLLDTAPDTAALTTYETVNDRVGDLLAAVTSLDADLDPVFAPLPPVPEATDEAERLLARASDALVTATGWLVRVQQRANHLTAIQSRSASEEELRARTETALERAFDAFCTFRETLINWRIEVAQYPAVEDRSVAE